MSEEHFNEIIKIDEATFNRSEPRSISSLEALRISDPDGCFVLIDNNRVVGYNYSKTMGNEGFLGPLGIIRKYQNKGFGKVLIKKTIEYLIKNCNVIGLEVLPENGNVIGLYQRIGFNSGFPSYLFQAHYGYEFEISSNEFNVTSSKKMSHSEFEKVLDYIERWTQSSYNGLSFKKQLDNTRKFKGEVLIAFNDGDPVGFLGYSKTLLPTLWGAISDVDNIKTQKEMMNDLLFHFNKINGFDDVVLK
jgi:GNAT superfamily N-acetyltransferase